MNNVLIVILILFLLGVFGAPVWPYSRELGWGPSGGLTLVLVVLLILWAMGKL